MTTIDRDRYEILGELGRGTTAVVYKARDSYLDRTVAIKIFRPDIVSLHESDSSLKRRFQQEAMAAGRLSHRSIVAVYDVGDAERTPYIVMEYVDGRTLAEVIAADGPLRAEAAARLGIQLCEGLEYAHRHGIVHRDIKPGNILLADDGIAKLTDFGIARIAGTNQTQSGAMLGTPAYMSPEQVRGQAADARSDVFALGVVLYETLAGAAPFRGDDLASVLYQIVHVEPPSLRTRGPSVPAALASVVTRALAKTPEGRYPTARALANALAQAVAISRPPAGARARAARSRSRVAGGRPAVAVGLAAVLALGVGAWAGSSRLPENAVLVPVLASDPEPGPALARAAAADSRVRRPPDPEPQRVPAPRAVVVSAKPSIDPRPEEPPRARAPQRPAPPRPERRATAPPETRRPVPGAPALSGDTACLSVNAVPFATVYVDGRRAGDTPKACLRLVPGAHRVQFEASGERSPERLVQVSSRHTADDPMRLSYDFNSGRFVDE